MLYDGRSTSPCGSCCLSDNGKEMKSDGVQSASSGEPADEAAKFRIRSRSTDVTGDVIIANGSLTADQPDSEAHVSWTWEDLVKEQKDDKDIGPILGWIQEGSEQPPWETVALHSADTKALWNMWPRLSVRDGVLKRRFEEADGLSNRWQIIIPKKYRYEFMELAHGGMTGGHLAFALVFRREHFGPCGKRT